jgi:hypothetical protein
MSLLHASAAWPGATTPPRCRGPSAGPLLDSRARVLAPIPAWPSETAVVRPRCGGAAMATHSSRPRRDRPPAWWSASPLPKSLRTTRSLRCWRAPSAAGTSSPRATRPSPPAPAPAPIRAARSPDPDVAIPSSCFVRNDAPDLQHSSRPHVEPATAMPARSRSPPRPRVAHEEATALPPRSGPRVSLAPCPAGDVATHAPS